jgi:hypothetical protein
MHLAVAARARALELPHAKCSATQYFPAIMHNALATSDMALAPAQEINRQTVRRVSDAPVQPVANDTAFFDATYEEFEAHRPMRGILLGVVLGALCWAGLIGLFVAL